MRYGTRALRRSVTLGWRACASQPPPRARLLHENRMAPAPDDLPVLRRVEEYEKAGAHADRTRACAQRARERGRREFSRHVRPDGKHPRALGEHRLPAARQDEIEPQPGRARMAGVLRDQDHAREHQGVVARQNHAQRGVPLCASQRVGTEQVVTDQALARGDALDHGRGVRFELDIARAEDAQQVPESRHRKAVLAEEEEADRRLFDVVGDDIARILFGLGQNELEELAVCLRHLRRRHEFLVVDEHRRLERGAVGLVVPHRPFGKEARFGGLVDFRVAVVRELDLQVHRRAPRDVARAAIPLGLREEAPVDLGAVHLVVLHVDPRVERLEIRDERRGLGEVHGRVDHDASFALRGCDELALARWVVLRHLRERRSRAERQGERRRDPPKADPRHATLYELRAPLISRHAVTSPTAVQGPWRRGSTMTMRLAVFCACAAICLGAAAAEQADLILRNGKVVTVDDRFTIARAIAIKGERVLATGGDRDTAKPAGPATRTIDLKGKTVIPGLIDNHAHFMRAAEYWHREVRLDGVTSRQRALEMIAAKARQSAPGEWVLALGGWSLEQFTDSQQGFTLAELDRAAPGNPVAPQLIYFRIYTNSAGLKAVSTDDTIVEPRGGKIEKDAAGQPTGELNGAGAVRGTLSKLGEIAMERMTQNARALLGELNRIGVTSYIDMGGRGFTG